MIATALVLSVPAAVVFPQEPDDDQDVPVTIKEIDLDQAIREFQDFQERLGEFREQIGEGRAVARETAQMLEELRSTAAPENDYNEEEILGTVAGYVDEVITKQVELVDFLESQRYRITYYASRMAASLHSEDLALLFGTEEQSRAAIQGRVGELASAREDLADYVDSLPESWLDRETFRPTRQMPRDAKRELDVLLYRCQQEKNALDLAKKRLEVVRASRRADGGQAGTTPDIDADLLVGRMFGALDRIRLQMSMDLLYLEHLLTGYSRSARTQEILAAFQDLVELQGDLEGPSPELAGVLDWLEDASTRRITVGAAKLTQPGQDVPTYSDLLRENYSSARDVETPEE